ncbi:acetyltransferase [Burkholderiaceae bacterium DAT-1]|nr:acetyltransferase [Burkholderiaceae bacterium DAT-1]
MQINFQFPEGIKGIAQGHPLSKRFHVFLFEDGSQTSIPQDFFTRWDGEFPQGVTIKMGKNSGFGLGSRVKYDGGIQILEVGNYVAAGNEIKIILNGLHDTQGLSSYMLGLLGAPYRPQPQLGNTVIENDVWIGDNVLILGQSKISNGCVVGAGSVVPPKKVLEPYGVYVGNPIKLVRFRFDEKVIAELLDIQWWNQPLSWIRQQKAAIETDLTEDVSKSLEILSEMKRSLV